MYIKSRFFYMIESSANRHSAVSAKAETVEFLERSLASMLMSYCCSMIGCKFFSTHNRFTETNSHLQLSYHITDRLLAAGNIGIRKSQFTRLKEVDMHQI